MGVCFLLNWTILLRDPFCLSFKQLTSRRVGVSGCCVCHGLLLRLEKDLGYYQLVKK